jgi:hypothetical protein
MSVAAAPPPRASRGRRIRGLEEGLTGSVRRRDDERAPQARSSALLMPPPAGGTKPARRQSLSVRGDVLRQLPAEAAVRAVEVPASALRTRRGKAEDLGWPYRPSELEELRRDRKWLVEIGDDRLLRRSADDAERHRAFRVRRGAWAKLRLFVRRTVRGEANLLTRAARHRQPVQRFSRPPRLAAFSRLRLPEKADRGGSDRQLPRLQRPQNPVVGGVCDLRGRNARLRHHQPLSVALERL